MHGPPHEPYLGSPSNFKVRDEIKNCNQCLQSLQEHSPSSKNVFKHPEDTDKPCFSDYFDFLNARNNSVCVCHHVLPPHTFNRIFDGKQELTFFKYLKDFNQN